MTVHDDPHTGRGPREPIATLRDQEARKSARIATIIAALAGVLALIALIVALVHEHDFASSNCNPETDYVCEPEVVEETVTVDVPTTSMSPTEVPVPSVTKSETVTTTVRP